MNRRIARTNRIGLAIVGVVLLLAAVLALLRAASVAPGVLGAADAPVTEQAQPFAADNAWFWPVVAAAAVLVALLALAWLLAQTRTRTLRALRVEQDQRAGSTTLPARAVTGALEDDLGSNPDVRRVHAYFTGSPSHPRLHLTATLASTVDPEPANQHLYQALEHQRQSLEMDDVPAFVRLRA